MVHIEVSKEVHVALLKTQKKMEKIEQINQEGLGMRGAVSIPIDRVLMRSFFAWEQVAGV